MRNKNEKIILEKEDISKEGYVSILDNINSEIRKSNYTVENLANDMGISRGTLSGYLKGQRSFPVEKYVDLLSKLDSNNLSNILFDFTNYKLNNTNSYINKINSDINSNKITLTKDSEYYKDIAVERDKTIKDLRVMIKEKDKQIDGLIKALNK